MSDDQTRRLSDEAARTLVPGDAHYTAFVGPPAQYDLMGATQFMLLITLGLRDHHRVLDFGCGSLRAGRLLIPYLRPGNYHGLESNSWLIEDAIERQLGRDQIAIKWPHFHVFDDFLPDHCGREFDFILAHSIFSHAGANIVERVLGGFSRILSRSGLALVTFVHPQQDGIGAFSGEGWVYPDVVAHAPDRIQAMIERAQLFGRPLLWYHPRQTWYALAVTPERLPSPAVDTHLRGGIIGVPEWEPSH